VVDIGSLHSLNVSDWSSNDLPACHPTSVSQRAATDYRVRLNNYVRKGHGVHI
jgi:hypothetical protein